MEKEDNKILLIHPPFYRLFLDTFCLNRCPISLGYLSGTIKKETNWDVMVYNADFNKNSHSGNYDVSFGFRSGTGFENYLNNLRDLSLSIWDEVRSIIKEYKPTVVGISTMTPNFASACNVAQLVKEFDENILVIVGGPHPSIAGKSSMACPYIDIAVRGEGEKTIVDLLNAVSKSDCIDNVKGIMFRNGKHVIENVPQDYIQSLDTLCFPFDNASEVLKDYEYYPITAFNNVFANRGCPYACSFCGSRGIWSKKVRFRPIDHLIAEIKNLQNMGVVSIYFCDDTFGVNKDWIVIFCNSLIKHCFGLKWSCEIHANIIDDKVLSIMKKAGCYKIELGIESGNNDILEKMKKQITIEKALEACNKIRRHGLELHAYFMAGFPFETESTLNDTLNAINKIDGHIMISVFTPYPGTELFEFCRENGLIDEKYDVAMHNHQSLDCFCLNFDPIIFKCMIENIEQIVDRKNKYYRMKRILSLNTIWRIKQTGLLNSIKKAIKIMN